MVRIVLFKLYSACAVHTRMCSARFKVSCLLCLLLNINQKVLMSIIIDLQQLSLL